MTASRAARHVTSADVDRIIASVSNWGRWGDDDELGTLNLVTPEKRVSAARVVTEGISVSCGWPLISDTPMDEQLHYAESMPARRLMIATGEGLADEPRTGCFGDVLMLGVHGTGLTHMDALCHMSWDKKMYNDRDASLVTSWSGAAANDIAAVSLGVTTRGVLLDIAGLHGVPWLENGVGAYPEDLDAAEARQGVRVTEGDALLVRTGYGRKRREHGPEHLSAGRPGLNVTCAEWLHERGVSIVASDCATDVHPYSPPDVELPFHVATMVSMGLCIIDNCQLEDLCATAGRLGRWDFLFTVSPLLMQGGTGSPVNPVATF